MGEKIDLHDIADLISQEYKGVRTFVSNLLGRELRKTEELYKLLEERLPVKEPEPEYVTLEGPDGSKVRVLASDMPDYAQAEEPVKDEEHCACSPQEPGWKVPFGRSDKGTNDLPTCHTCGKKQLRCPVCSDIPCQCGKERKCWKCGVMVGYIRPARSKDVRCSDCKPAQEEEPFNHEEWIKWGGEAVEFSKKQWKEGIEFGKRLERLSQSLDKQNTHDFMWAVEQMKAGGDVQRSSWLGDRHVSGFRETVVIKTPSGKYLPYNPTLADITATDWEISDG